jgi:ATP-dependent DNA helicase DinG
VADAFASDGPIARADPAYRMRDGQVQLAQAIADAIQSGGQVIAEAATGIGKTFAYLVPILLAGGTTVISTGTRQLQDQLHEKDLVRLRGWLGLSFRTAILKGRSNYVCPYHLERNLADGRYADPSIPSKLRIISTFATVDPVGDKAGCSALSEDDPAWALATSTRDDCLGQECPRLAECPLARARQRAQRADVVVVNHHLYCADLALKDGAFGDFLPEAATTVFDEAHLLPDVAAEFFGESTSTRQLSILARDLARAARLDAPDQRELPVLAAEIEGAARQLRACLPLGAGRFGHASLQTLLADDPALALALDTIPGVLDRAASALEAVAERSPELGRCGERAAELGLAAQRWLALSRATGGAAAAAETTADATDEPAVVWLQVSARHAALRLTPLSVAARFAHDRAARPGCRIYVSATLAVAGDLGHFSRTIGADRAPAPAADHAARLVIASPFDYPRQAALWLADGLGPPGQPGHTERMVARIWPLIEQNGGRAFVLCTTLRAVGEAARLLRARGGGLTVLAQGDASRQQLLEQFRAGGSAVLVGSASFWQGVDVPGDALSLVVIDKIPFAPPDDPVYAARSQAIERAGGNGFDGLALPLAALTLKQGAGRLIRSERDRGVLVLCDERLRTRGYGRRLLAGLPPFARAASIDEARGFLPAR